MLPNEFLQNEELPVDDIIKNFSKTLHAPAVSLPRHNSSAQLPDERGRRHSERYDNTGLFTVTYQLIYRHCTCTAKVSWSTSDQSDRRLEMLAGVHRAPPELWP